MFSVGNGRRIHFWKDLVREMTLSSSFPSLFAAAAHKEVSVADLCDSSREEGVGPLAFQTF